MPAVQIRGNYRCFEDDKVLMLLVAPPRRIDLARALEAAKDDARVVKEASNLTPDAEEVAKVKREVILERRHREEGEVHAKQVEAERDQLHGVIRQLQDHVINGGDAKAMAAQVCAPPPHRETCVLQMT